jgi:hypothetical protein
MVFLLSVRRLLVRASVIPTSTVFYILMIETPSSSETSVLTRAVLRKIKEDAILLVPHIFQGINYFPLQGY